jgi:hypothetical protein
MPSLPFTLVRQAHPASLLAIEAVLTVATRAVAVVPVSAASAVVADHAFAVVAASAADDVAPPAAFSHHSLAVASAVGDLAPVFAAASADPAPAWHTICPAVAGISDLPADCLYLALLAVGEGAIRSRAWVDDSHCCFRRCLLECCWHCAAVLHSVRLLAWPARRCAR